MKTQNEQTKLLWKELESLNPDESKIRELVAQGADVTGEFLKNAICTLSPPPDMWDVRRKPIDMKFMQLLIEMGADVNYVDDEDTGFNSLFEAALSWNVELTEILLKAGANPNSTSSETFESILSYVSCDQYYETHIMDRGGSDPLAKIEWLIEEYGGKHFHELFTGKVQKFLTICDNYEAGLITRTGNARIESIAGEDQELIKEFNEWLNSAPEKLKPFEYYRRRDIINLPDAEIVRRHNAKGLELANRIRAIIDPNIKIEYSFINADELENSGVIKGQSTFI